MLTTLPKCLYVLSHLPLRLQLMIMMTIAMVMAVARRNHFSATREGFICLFFLFSIILAISSYGTLRALFCLV